MNDIIEKIWDAIALFPFLAETFMRGINMNTELLAKIHHALQSPFIGDIIFSDDEIKEMREDCKKSYRNMQGKYGATLSMAEVDKLVVLIINIAKQWVDESEGRFWVKLYNEIFEDGSIQPAKFYNDYEACLKRYNHVLFRSKERKRMFRETFLLHAFAPETSSDSFIRLLWGWYSDNEILNFDYRKEEDYSLVQKFNSFLQHTFSDETEFDDDVSFEGKTYQIKSSFKYLFSQDSESGYALLDSIFTSFNTVYRAQEKRNDSFFWTRCSVVINKMLEEARVSRSGRRSFTRNQIIDDYSKIHIDYGFTKENEVVLVIPEIRAIDEIAEEYKLTVFNNEEKIYEYDGYILGEGFRRKIKHTEIPLDEFSEALHDDLCIRVTLSLNRNGNTEVIYDSKQSLIRDYILFKSSREIRVEVCNPGNYYVILPESINIAKHTNCATDYVNELVTSLVAEEGNYIALNSRRTFFSTKQKGFSQFIPDCESIDNLFYLHNGMEIPVFKTIRGISILSPEITENPTSIVMVINEEKKVVLSDVVQYKESLLYVNLMKEKSIFYGYNNITFVNMSKNKVVYALEFCANDKIKITCSKYAFSSKGAKLSVRGSDEPFEKIIAAENESAQFTFYEDDYVYKLPYLSWRIDKNEWYYNSFGDILWCKDELLHNNCVIEICNNSCCSVSLTANAQPIEESDEGIYRLGDILTSLESSPIVSITLSIDQKPYEILKIANEEILDDFDIDIEEKQVSILPYFVGSDNSQFSVELIGDETSYTLELDDEFKFEEDIEDGYYDVTISLKDFFGDGKVLLEGEYAIGNPDKIAFVNCNIVLKRFNKPDGGKVKLADVYIENIEYLRNEGDIAVYSGVLKFTKKKIFVEVHVRDENVLNIYQTKDDTFSMLSYDLNKKVFISAEPNGENLIPFGSCYYGVEEL